jgi:hypothetical protein
MKAAFLVKRLAKDILYDGRILLAKRLGTAPNCHPGLGEGSPIRIQHTLPQKKHPLVEILHCVQDEGRILG